MEAKISLDKWNDFKAFKKSVENNQSEINVIDLGAGSHKLKSAKRKVSNIARIAGMTTGKAVKMMKILNYFQPKKILELGTSVGVSTFVFKNTLPHSEIVTIEGCPNTQVVAKAHLKEFKQISFINSEFTEGIAQLSENQSFDFIYFDGNHQKEATIKYFESCLKFVHNDTFFIFDDIHWSREMEEAWQVITNHKKVKVSIDKFHFGLIFFRKELSKQNFIL
jgi:predicted O-methyltransferase YrrM